MPKDVCINREKYSCNKAETTVIGRYLWSVIRQKMRVRQEGHGSAEKKPSGKIKLGSSLR